MNDRARASTLLPQPNTPERVPGLLGVPWRSLAAALLTLLSAACGSEKASKKATDPGDLAFLRPDPIIVSGAGFKNPDAVIYDELSDVYLVSNMNGEPTDKTDNGFISRVSPDGKVLDLKWIDGATEGLTLRAPRGMALAGKRLYVADIDTLRIYNRKTGKIQGKIRVPMATYLNAVSAAPDGTIYTTDSGLRMGKSGVEPTGKDSIHRVSKWGQWRRVARGKNLNQPDGVVADNKGAWVVTGNANELYRVTKSGKIEKPFTLPSKQLDGLVRMNDGSFLISSAAKGTVLVGLPGGDFKVAVDRLSGPGNIGYDPKRERILIPLPQKHELRLHPLSGFEEAASAVE